jgi:hypothetical protein
LFYYNKSKKNKMEHKIKKARRTGRAVAIGVIGACLGLSLFFPKYREYRTIYEGMSVTTRVREDGVNSIELSKRVPIASGPAHATYILYARDSDRSGKFERDEVSNGALISRDVYGPLEAYANPDSLEKIFEFSTRRH